MKTYKTIVSIAPIVSFFVLGIITILVDHGHFCKMTWELWAWVTIGLSVWSVIVNSLFSKKEYL